MNSKSLEYEDVLYFLPPAPPHGMYHGVSSYGMEADPQGFLLSDGWLMWDIDISLIMKNSICDLDLKGSKVGDGDGTA